MPTTDDTPGTTAPGYAGAQEDVLKRLRRVEGQVLGIQQMSRTRGTASTGASVDEQEAKLEELMVALGRLMGGR